MLWIIGPGLNIPFISIVTASVQNFGCLCAQENQKRCRITKNTDAVVQRKTINFDVQLWKSTSAIIIYLVPCTDTQKLGRTTRNCNLVVRGTTTYFSLIRTLVTAIFAFSWSRGCGGSTRTQLVWTYTWPIETQNKRCFHVTSLLQCLRNEV